MDFLSYNPTVYKFLYNLSYQLLETMLFTDVAPVLMEEYLCFLFYIEVDDSIFKVYRAINSILNNNFSNFDYSYRVDFEKHFERDLTLLRIKLIAKYFFYLAFNKRMVSEHEEYLQTYLSKTLTYEYVLQPGSIPVYGMSTVTHDYSNTRIDY